MIEPEVCPYCKRHDATRFVTAWVDDNKFIEQYNCDNCDKYYHVEYDFANPRYQEE